METRLHITSSRRPSRRREGARWHALPPHFALTGMDGCGGGTRTCDLRLMRPASYRCSTHARIKIDWRRQHVDADLLAAPHQGVRKEIDGKGFRRLAVMGGDDRQRGRDRVGKGNRQHAGAGASRLLVDRHPAPWCVLVSDHVSAPSFRRLARKGRPGFRRSAIRAGSRDAVNVVGRIRASDSFRPIGRFGPVGREPKDCSIKPMDTDIRPGADGSNPFAVIKHARRHRGLCKPCSPAIGIHDGE